MPLFERREYESWTRYIPSRPARVVRPPWSGDIRIDDDNVLPFGLGRSCGDVCLNNGGTLIDTARLNNFRAFDEATGVLDCESGLTLAEIERLFVPRGWFVPVTPGTKFVTVGGCIANDVHGKNHHRAGTFGRFVRSIELQRSDGSRVHCTPDSELFRATIGGLGLTGLIVSAQIQLRPLASASMTVERIPFRTLGEFLALSDASAGQYEHTVAWFDALTGSDTRGIFFRGNHAERGESLKEWQPAPSRKAPAPLLAPMMNRLTVGAFNDLYFLAQSKQTRHYIADIDTFFYPLDVLENWNRIYGRHGYLQYQSVVPAEAGKEPAAEMLARVRRSGAGSFLTVIKSFGDVPSPGMLSFPRAGITISLDFAGRNRQTLALCEALDDIVEASGGRVYPAKDARMSPARFRRYYPQWEEFAQHVDPHFSSSFWRRVTQ
jgi:FAD/FMN-containing dehydrogenase